METRNIIALISRIGDKAHDFISNRLREHGIGDIVPSHGSILANLYSHGPMPMKDLAERIQRKKNTVTVLVEKLIRLGYITRKEGPGDRRTHIISLTDKAMEIQEDFYRISEELINKTYQGVSAEEQIQLISLLKKIEKNF